MESEGKCRMEGVSSMRWTIRYRKVCDSCVHSHRPTATVFEISNRTIQRTAKPTVYRAVIPIQGYNNDTIDCGRSLGSQRCAFVAAGEDGGI